MCMHLVGVSCVGYQSVYFCVVHAVPRMPGQGCWCLHATLSSVLPPDASHAVWCRDVLVLSRVPNRTLMLIWALVDKGNHGWITYDQLLVVFALISQAQRGQQPTIAGLDLATVSPPQFDGIAVEYTEVWM